MSFYLKRIKSKKDCLKNNEILHCMLELQNLHGGVLNPLILSKHIFQYLKDNYPNGKNYENARDTAFVFAALCNEYRILHKSNKIYDEFFISEGRWEKYLIGKKTREKSIKILKEMKWINFETKVIRSAPIFRIKMFNINTDFLFSLVNEEQEKYDEEYFQKIRDEETQRMQQKRLYYEDDFDRALDECNDLNEMFDRGFYF